MNVHINNSDGSIKFWGQKICVHGKWRQFQKIGKIDAIVTTS